MKSALNVGHLGTEIKNRNLPKRPILLLPLGICVSVRFIMPFRPRTVKEASNRFRKSVSSGIGTVLKFRSLIGIDSRLVSCYGSDLSFDFPAGGLWLTSKCPD